MSPCNMSEIDDYILLQPEKEENSKQGGDMGEHQSHVVHSYHPQLYLLLYPNSSPLMRFWWPWVLTEINFAL